jgi:hypothetical protein
VRKAVDCVYKYYSLTSFDSGFLFEFFMLIGEKYEVFSNTQNWLKIYISKGMEKYNLFYSNTVKIKDWIPSW